MSKETASNLVASIRQRLLNLARQRNNEFQIVLIHYGLERLLFRLSISNYAGQFTLKGALLFQIWIGQPHRSTLDLDLLGKGESELGRLEQIFREICSIEDPNDGLTFYPDSVRGEEIREEQRYQGVRIHTHATLGNAKIPIQIDIGFGDAITPAALKIEYPTLLGLPAPKLKAYPKETVVAEKFEAMVSLGMANSRMKDFYDLWMLARENEFEASVLAKAVQATFTRRGTELPANPPVALTAEFAADRAKQGQWRAFVGKGKLMTAVPPFSEVIEVLNAFLWPLVEWLRQGSLTSQRWKKQRWI